MKCRHVHNTGSASRLHPPVLTGVSPTMSMIASSSSVATCFMGVTSISEEGGAVEGVDVELSLSSGFLSFAVVWPEVPGSSRPRASESLLGITFLHFTHTLSPGDRRPCRDL